MAFEEATDLAQTDEARHFLAVWRPLVADEALPDRRDIDPAALKSILAHIWIYQQIDGGSDYVCRLVGDEIRRQWNRPMMGRNFSEFVDPDRGRRMIDHLNRSIERIVLTIGLTTTANEYGWYAERIYAPIRMDGGWGVLGCSRYVTTRFVDTLEPDHSISSFHLFDAVTGEPRGEEDF